MRIAGNAIRVVVELIGTATGPLAWGDRFNFEMVDILAVQDEIVGAVIGHLAFKLTGAEGRKRQRDPTSSSSAYTHFLQARAAWRSGDGPQAMQAAQKIVEIYPGYGRAHAHIGYFYSFSHFSQWTGLDGVEIDGRALAAIERALTIDRGDPFIQQRASKICLLLGASPKALRYAEFAALVSARGSELLVIHGMAVAYCDDHAKGCAMLERAVTHECRLKPSLYLGLIEVHHMMGVYVGSLAVMEMMPDRLYDVRLYEAASLVRLGRTSEARRTLDQAPAGFDLPKFARIHVCTFALTKDAEQWLDSFRLANIEV